MLVTPDGHRARRPHRGRHASARARCAARSSCAGSATTCSTRRCAATSTRGCRSSRPGSTRRSCWPTRGCAGSGWPAGRCRRCRSTRPCRRSARARSRSSAAQATAICSACSRRFEHTPSRVCIEAERAFLPALGGDCNTPLAGHARLDKDGSQLRFDGMVASAVDDRMVRAGTERYADATGDALIELARALGREVGGIAARPGRGRDDRRGQERGGRNAGAIPGSGRTDRARAGAQARARA